MNDEFYNSKRWRELRKSILVRDKYLDQYQKRYGRFRNADVVHHIFPVSDFPEYKWEKWNLISVSASTHSMFHDRDTNELTDIGKELLLRTGRKNNIFVPEWAIKETEKRKKFRYWRERDE